MSEVISVCHSHEPKICSSIRCMTEPLRGNIFGWVRLYQFAIATRQRSVALFDVWQSLLGGYIRMSEVISVCHSHEANICSYIRCMTEPLGGDIFGWVRLYQFAIATRQISVAIFDVWQSLLGGYIRMSEVISVCHSHEANICSYIRCMTEPLGGIYSDEWGYISLP